MGKFVKGMKRPPGAGRKKGAPNRVTVTVRNAWEAAFGKLQRDKERNLLAWAKDSPENLKVFYGLSTKLMPLIELNVESKPNIDARTPEGLLEGARRIAFALAKAANAMDAAPQPPLMLGVSEPEKTVVTDEVVPEVPDPGADAHRRRVAAEARDDQLERDRIAREAAATVRTTFMGNGAPFRRRR